ncbi:MAG: flagellar assembly peptidoglycan hydrolase FlgJ [Sulfuritalea sp.]|nr:flagellar assembly peptidoglycan hydrolase FlgJ [Sulfuritalea sp.]
MNVPNDRSTLSATSNILDVGSLGNLKRQARSGDPDANKAVAKEFESMFLQMVLKSMRDATPREGLFDSDQSRLYQSLLDQQLSRGLGSGKGGLGLAAMIEAQLSRRDEAPLSADGPLQLAPKARAFPLQPEIKALPLRQPAATGFELPQPVAPARTADPAAGAPTEVAPAISAAQRDFVDRLLPAALSAQRATGIPAPFMVAQAALETGWGRAEPRRADGSTSFNIFGIKAGAGWQGPTVESRTTEVIMGVAQSRVERFRAYGSHAEAFADYANLMMRSPRYAPVREARDAADFARGLQQAGYATDPQYAAKLERIIGGAALKQTLTG